MNLLSVNRTGYDPPPLFPNFLQIIDGEAFKSSVQYDFWKYRIGCGNFYWTVENKQNEDLRDLRNYCNQIMSALRLPTNFFELRL